MPKHLTSLTWIVQLLGALPTCQNHLWTLVIHQDKCKLIHQQLLIKAALQKKSNLLMECLRS